jgi:hypothetical protein
MAARAGFHPDPCPPGGPGTLVTIVETADATKRGSLVLAALAWVSFVAWICNSHAVTALLKSAGRLAKKFL